MQSPPASTRDRLIAAMADALRQRGFHGVGLSEILQAANAPKGVLYHHFPGGKSELAAVAIDHAVQNLTQSLAKLLAQSSDPLDALKRWLHGAGQQMRAGRFEAGCPLATVALESRSTDTELRVALARGFQSIRNTIAVAFEKHGLAPQRARSLAALLVSAYEGGLMQSRVEASSAAMDDTHTALIELLEQQLRSEESR